ncbi:tetratricopeptide repeat protein [Actinomadura monticuli]|uniref:Sel1 repeat family protein n=1 Tax=Actinomadura monticuli TaxID=3097367 RepID=A0ABV4QHJ4_9ACTN
MSGDGLSQGIGPAAKIALRGGAAAEDDEDAAALWCSRLAGFGLVEAARDHFRPAAGAGDLAAAKCMVWLAWEAGLDGDARTWLDRAARTGDPWAMFELGRSVQEPDEAERWYRRAAEAGAGIAMNNLAVQHVLEGEHAEAERWFRRAADAGNVDGTANLGRLKLEAGDLRDAETWLTAAVEQGHGGAAEQLACLLADAGRTEEAEVWRARSAARR